MGARGPLDVFFAVSPEKGAFGASAGRNIGWGSAHTALASKDPQLQSDLQLSHGAC